MLPFQSLEGGDLDNISMEDGHLFLRIPLISYPQRGGAMKLSYSLMSNNYGWATVPNGQNVLEDIRLHFLGTQRADRVFFCTKDDGSHPIFP